MFKNKSNSAPSDAPLEAMQSVETMLLNGKVRLMQPAQGFRASIDTVFVAAGVKAKPGQNVLDAGSGAGGIAMCLAARFPEISVLGVELQESYFKLAQENAALNGVQDRVSFLCHDIRTLNTAPFESFDHYVCNPPYLEKGSFIEGPNAERNAAIGSHREEQVRLEDWVFQGYRYLKPGGWLTMIHRGEMLQKLFLAMKHKFGGVEVFPMFPKSGHAAKRVVIRAKKDSKSPTIIHPGMILHKEDDTYTPQANTILRAGAGLFDK